jgi:hypothetical protein
MITRAPVALRLQASSCEDARRASGLPANPRAMFAKQRAALVCAPRRQPTLPARKFQVRYLSSATIPYSPVDGAYHFQFVRIC